MSEIHNQPTFIDLFAGCGGLSLGLLRAGWRGIFAVEKHEDAFNTLRHNLIDKHENNIGQVRYTWNSEIDLRPHDIVTFIKEYGKVLYQLKGQVDLVAGGPPCQGFSFAGKRKSDDPRNELFRRYVEIVHILEPKLLVIENVEGISVAHRSKKERNNKDKSYASYYEQIKEKLHADYKVHGELIRSIDFGLPQKRPRFFIVGVRRQYLKYLNNRFEITLRDWLVEHKQAFLENRGLPNRTMTAGDAISDLHAGTEGENTIPWEPSLKNDYYKVNGHKFKVIKHNGPSPGNEYQQLMNRGMNGRQPNSLRMANHRNSTRQRFREIIKWSKENQRQGIQISSNFRESMKIKKQMLATLDSGKPSHTITTLPDDLLHYDEPRILTARECARIQSFPDWYEFTGPYTTGGKRRKKTCPRYTQIGNAVPPLLAEQLGCVLLSLLLKLSKVNATHDKLMHVIDRFVEEKTCSKFSKHSFPGTRSTVVHFRGERNG